MVKSSDEPSLLDRVRSIAPHSNASSKSNGAVDSLPVTTLNKKRRKKDREKQNSSVSITGDHAAGSHDPANDGSPVQPDAATRGGPTANNPLEALPPPAPPPPGTDHGDTSSTIESGEDEIKPNVVIRIYRVGKAVLLSSWMNVLLIFVPVGIAVQAAHVNPNIVFAMNAIAIVPLAGLLSHATESVASEMGDTIGSLMNVTFGNAVELIILCVSIR